MKAVRSGPRVIVAPDKFRGSVTAAEAATYLTAGLTRHRPDLDVRRRPIADGGEGTLEAFAAAGFDLVPVAATGPLGGEPRTTHYARRGDTAVVELAAVSGLRLLPPGANDPVAATSLGTGEVLRAALDAGCDHVILAVGGSAGTDGGAGLLHGLGARLLDDRGSVLAPDAAALHHVRRLDLDGLHPRCADVRLVLAADVGNPLLGPDGAAAVYAPQKGATPAQVRELDTGLARWSTVVREAVGEADPMLPGAGAAGGVGFAALAVLHAVRCPGVDVVLDLTGLRGELVEAELVITGEGSLDAQSLQGKAPVGLARAARTVGTPVVAVAGRCSLSAGELRDAGFAGAYALLDLVADAAQAVAEAPRLLTGVGERIAREWVAERA